MDAVEEKYKAWARLDTALSHHPLDIRRFNDLCEAAGAIDRHFNDEWLTIKFIQDNPGVDINTLKAYAAKFEVIVGYLQERSSRH
jgi:hypothetical protein